MQPPLQAASVGAAVVVLDNGAGSCKLGFASEAAPRKVFPNCVAKAKGERTSYVGDMLLESKELSQLTLRRPFDRGYLVNWDLEREIWIRGFKSVLGLSVASGRSAQQQQAAGALAPSSCALIMTEPIFNFPQLQQAAENVVFEDFGFCAYYAAPATTFSLRRMAALTPSLPAAAAGAGVVVDAGFSFTHVVPYFEGKPLMQGVKRINVGGKLLTNYLKELVSYRSLNMSDEPYLMECVKEALCFVSEDVALDLKRAALPGGRSPHRREFVLPDGVSNFRGYVREPAQPPPSAREQADGQPQPAQQQRGAGQPGEQQHAAPPGRSQAAGADIGDQQALPLNNERFMVPEVLFHPSDIGLMQAGVAEAVVRAVQAVHPSLHALLFSNVILTGGVVSCPGFSKRFESELRPLVPDDCALGVRVPPDPAKCAWEGMAAFAASPAFAQVVKEKPLGL